MAKKTLTIIFEEDGTVKKETSGFEGKSCEVTTAFIEELLKAKDIKRTRKAEFFRMEPSNTNTKHKNIN